MMRALAAVVAAVLALSPAAAPGRGLGHPPHTHPAAAVPTQRVAAVPEARYDAVIPGLDAAAPKTMTGGPALVFRLTADVPLYGNSRDHPVARLAARNFLKEPTVVLGYPARPDGWQLLLTPARRQRPSEGPGATAQSYGWARAADLPVGHKVMSRIEISVSRQQITVRGPGGTRTYPAGVGAEGTPTPRGVTGYLQARYLDPRQGQAVHRIQLTSLHAVGADEPYGGSDGGLIGIHLGSGASHGCVRVGPDAIAVIDALPLGTPIRMVG